MIVCKSQAEIEKLRRSGRMARELLEELQERAQPGVSTLELEKYIERRTPGVQRLQGLPVLFVRFGE